MSKKNQNVDYFSDDEAEQINDNMDDNLGYDSEEEMDSETREIIWAALQKAPQHDFKSELDNLDKEKKNKSEKKHKRQQENNKKNLSLSEFNKKIEAESKEKEPKKFTSKRVEQKKKELGISEPVYVRKFNPRHPPFNFVNKN